MVFCYVSLNRLRQGTTDIGWNNPSLHRTILFIAGYLVSLVPNYEILVVLLCHYDNQTMYLHISKCPVVENNTVPGRKLQKEAIKKTTIIKIGFIIFLDLLATVAEGFYLSRVRQCDIIKKEQP